MGSGLVLLMATFVSVPGMPGQPPPYRRPPPPAENRPRAEWSMWVRYGPAHVQQLADGERLQHNVALYGELTFELQSQGRLRWGPWVEIGALTRGGWIPTAGLELATGGLPRRLRLFFYRGEGSLSLRVGGGVRRFGGETTPIGQLSVSYGYRAPWKKVDWRETMRPRRKSLAYAIGARLFFNYQQSLDDRPTGSRQEASK